MKTYNQELKNKLDSLNDEFNKREFFEKETTKKYINVTNSQLSDFAYDDLKETLKSILDEYESRLTIHYIQDNTRNFENVFDSESENKIILDISSDDVKWIMKEVKNLDGYSDTKNKKDFIDGIKEILQDLQYRVLDDFDVEEYDSFYSDMRDLEEKHNENLNIYDLVIDYLKNNLQDNYYTFEVEARGYSQGDYDKYTFVIFGDKVLSKQFENQITKPLESIFTTQELNISINESVKYTYFTKDNIKTETETIEEEIESFWMTILGSETQEEIRKDLLESYTDYIIFFKD